MRLASAISVGRQVMDSVKRLKYAVGEDVYPELAKLPLPGDVKKKDAQTKSAIECEGDVGEGDVEKQEAESSATKYEGDVEKQKAEKSAMENEDDVKKQEATEYEEDVEKKEAENHRLRSSKRMLRHI